jgi:tetratricopeptide (TPR) repeat protein
LVDAPVETESSNSSEMDVADKLKEEGNAAFRQGNLPLALSLYNQAIQINPNHLLCFTNRSMVHLKLGK